MAGMPATRAGLSERCIAAILIVPSLPLQERVAKSMTGGVLCHLQIAHLEAFAASHLGLLN